MTSTISSAPPGATYEVLNQPPPRVDYNAFDADVALREALIREGGKWGLGRGLAFGDLPLGVDGASIVERSLAL